MDLGGGCNKYFVTILRLSHKKRDDGGGGVKNYQILRDVIYGRPLKASYPERVK